MVKCIIYLHFGSIGTFHFYFQMETTGSALGDNEPDGDARRSQSDGAEETMETDGEAAARAVPDDLVNKINIPLV